MRDPEAKGVIANFDDLDIGGWYEFFHQALDFSPHIKFEISSHSGKYLVCLCVPYLLESFPVTAWKTVQRAKLGAVDILLTLKRLAATRRNLSNPKWIQNNLLSCLQNDDETPLEIGVSRLE